MDGRQNAYILGIEEAAFDWYDGVTPNWILQYRSMLETIVVGGA